MLGGGVGRLDLHLIHTLPYLIHTHARARTHSHTHPHQQAELEMKMEKALRETRPEKWGKVSAV